MGWWIVGGILVALIVLAFVFFTWRPLWHWSVEVNAERARELFRLQRERLEARFLSAASATGKPRGLRWVECLFEGDACFARDRHTRQLLALVQVTIRFEAIEGSDMEGLPAVGNLRNASAVFFFHGGHWLTAGKAVFNMNPPDAIQYFSEQYELLTELG